MCKRTFAEQLRCINDENFAIATHQNVGNCYTSIRSPFICSNPNFFAAYGMSDCGHMDLVHPLGR